MNPEPVSLREQVIRIVRRNGPIKNHRVHQHLARLGYVTTARGVNGALLVGEQKGLLTRGTHGLYDARCSHPRYSAGHHPDQPSICPDCGSEL